MKNFYILKRMIASREKQIKKLEQKMENGCVIYADIQTGEDISPVKIIQDLEKEINKLKDELLKQKKKK
ncbi:MAG: hypothetical protein HY606_00380 [Planctomycetes bacterium]|nr:hypothetical protein [Planctomycetota bacterium]